MGREHDHAVAHAVGAVVMCELCEDDLDWVFHCADCGMWTSSVTRKGVGGEYYMVQHRHWDTFGADRRMLCIGCLEKRMGRELVPADFLDCSLNKIEYQPKSLRLMRRLGYAS